MEDRKESVVAHREDASVQVKAVQNVAFADANQKQQPSLFTRRMFMVPSPTGKQYMWWLI